MNTFEIKIVAIITMIIDHIGLFFFPHMILFRVIGRLSFPLFAWLIANGAYYTKDIDNYLLRITIVALISQTPFILANRQITPSFWYLNVLFTLLLGLFAIKIIKQYHDTWLGIVITLLCAFLGYLLHTDYGAMGVISIVIFYIFFKNIKLTVISQSLLFLLPLLEQIFLHALNHTMLSIDILSYIEPLGLFSLIFIYTYNQQEGYKSKYLFYCFYPLQYCFIFLVNLIR